MGHSNIDVAICSAVQCIQCSVVLCSAVQCSVVQCNAVQCSEVQWIPVKCSTGQYSAASVVQCSGIGGITCTCWTVFLNRPTRPIQSLSCNVCLSSVVCDTFAVAMSICLCVYLSHFFLTPINNLFAPTSWSSISKLFRFSESLGDK